MKKRPTPAPNEHAQITNRRRRRLIAPDSHETFHFPFGLPAFEEYRNFVFLRTPQVQPFVMMQALDDAALSFVCIDPFLICHDYRVSLDDAATASLHLDRPEDAWVVNLVTLRDRVEDVTVNMMSPVVLNMAAHRGQQVILEDSSYPLRFKVYEAAMMNNLLERVG